MHTLDLTEWSGFIAISAETITEQSETFCLSYFELLTDGIVYSSQVELVLYSWDILKKTKLCDHIMPYIVDSIIKDMPYIWEDLV